MTIDEKVELVRTKATPWVADLGCVLVEHPSWDHALAMRCVPATATAFRSFRGNAVAGLIDWLRDGGPLPEPFDRDGFYHWIVHCVCEYVNRSLNLEGDDQLKCRHVTLAVKSTDGLPDGQVVGSVQSNARCPGHAPFSDN